MADQQDIPHHLSAVAEEVAAIRAQMARTGYAFVAWGHALARHAEAAYHSAHGQLPGSTKTFRLRKRRQAMVWRWYLAQLEGLGSQQEGQTDG
jgi:hypothetical protein